MHGSKYVCREDAAVARQCEAKQHYWKEVLGCVVADITYLGARGLFGNYSGLLDLILETDLFLKEHI